MKLLSIVAMVLLALTSGVYAKITTYDYLYEGQFVYVFTEDDEHFELRYIPGWRLDPKCPLSKWGEGICSGGLGYLLFFDGEWSGNTLNGDARLDKDGCDEPFKAVIRKTKDGTLVLSPVDGPPKCKAIFKPVRCGRIRSHHAKIGLYCSRFRTSELPTGSAKR
jgi:hypothetical protein